MIVRAKPSGTPKIAEAAAEMPMSVRPTTAIGASAPVWSITA